MELTFWLAIAFVAYVYVGYPVLLRLWAARSRRADDMARSRCIGSG